MAQVIVGAKNGRVVAFVLQLEMTDEPLCGVVSPSGVVCIKVRRHNGERDNLWHLGIPERSMVPVKWEGSWP